MELNKKTAFELSDMLRKKECSAVEILEDINNVIAEDKEIGAYITLNSRAGEIARAVDRAIAAGEQLHPLAGIPVAVKDNISTKGMLTTCASRMLENYSPPFNATVYEKITDANMVVTGKTNLDEFAMGSSTTLSYMNITRNPINTECPADGSAAAVASGQAVLALGTDTGGAIRQAASYCGIVGLKPTFGSVSRYGLIAFASSLDQIGPMGKSVRDVAMLQGLIAGQDRMDASTKSINGTDYAANLSSNVKGLRIGIPKEYLGGDTDTDIKDAVYNAVKLLEAQGALVREISLPAAAHASVVCHIIGAAEASSNLARYDGVKFGYRTKEYSNWLEMFEKSRGEGFGDEVKFTIMLGTYVLAAGNYDRYFKKSMLIRRQISAEFADAFKDCDIIASPSTPSCAFGINEKKSGLADVYKRNKFLIPANLAGLPAISVPCGSKSDGMPFGIQFIADKFREQLLLDAAFAYENIREILYKDGHNNERI